MDDMLIPESSLIEGDGAVTFDEDKVEGKASSEAQDGELDEPSKALAAEVASKAAEDGLGEVSSSIEDEPSSNALEGDLAEPSNLSEDPINSSAHEGELGEVSNTTGDSLMSNNHDDEHQELSNPLEESNNCHEVSSNSLEGLEEPSNSLEKSSNPLDKSNNSVESSNSLEGLEEPSSSLEEPSSSLEEPSSSLKEPSNCLEEPTNLLEPSNSSEELGDVSDSAVELVEPSNPFEDLEAPSNPLEEPGNSLEEPSAPVENMEVDDDKEEPTSMTDPNAFVDEVQSFLPVDDVEEQVKVNKIAKMTDTIRIASIMNSQIPDDLSPEELEYFKQNFGPINVAVQLTRIHCSACNAHLGSAPNKQDQRCIHPLLKVIICKECFDFYGSGDFVKDSDGSELYCRWCGQGGNVLCCAQCPYVFCQKCIRTNLGKKKLAKIKESDDWICFVCKPSDIIKHRVTCRALYDFVQQELAVGDEERLERDSTTCCRKPLAKPYSAKRALEELDDEEYPYLPNNKKAKNDDYTYTPGSKKASKAPAPALPKVWDASIEDEVVCTPDLSMLMPPGDDEDDGAASMVTDPPSPEPPLPLGLNPPALTPFQKILKNDEVSFVGETRITHKNNPNPFAYKVRSVSNTPAPPTPTAVSPSFIKLQQPAVKPTNNVATPVFVSQSSRLAPGLKYDWFDTAAQRTARVNRNLSTRLCVLSKQQISVTSLEGLANVHNSLQEILSTSINNLMQIRRNLKNNFILGLKKLKFCKATDVPPPVQQTSPDNDDVIFIDNTNQSTTSSNSPPDPSRPFLKVKSIAQLRDEPPLLHFTPKVTNPQPAKTISKLAKLLKPKEKSNDSTSSYVNPNSVLSEVADESTNPETLKLIKTAVIESKFEAVVANNLKCKTSQVSKKELKNMLSVRVVLSNKVDSTMPAKILKQYKPFVYKKQEKQVKRSKRNGLADATSNGDKTESNVLTESNAACTNVNKLDKEMANEECFKDAEEFLKMNGSVLEKDTFELSDKSSNEKNGTGLLGFVNGVTNF